MNKGEELRSKTKEQKNFEANDLPNDGNIFKRFMYLLERVNLVNNSIMTGRQNLFIQYFMREPVLEPSGNDWYCMIRHPSFIYSLWDIQSLI